MVIKYIVIIIKIIWHIIVFTVGVSITFFIMYIFCKIVNLLDELSEESNEYNEFGYYKGEDISGRAVDGRDGNGNPR
jgi:hypothetical protein